MKKMKIRGIHFVLGGIIALSCIYLQQSVSASPFGQGIFSADVPFGANTSLAIALGGDVSFNLTPSGPNLVGSGSHTLTVTSTDVIGYKLYVFSPSSTSMTNGSDTISASSNVSALPLSVNTWGYNTTGSTTNFIGILSTPTLIKDASGPFKNGDNTTVTYGAVADITKGAGSYSVGVVYTAVAENE